MSADPMGVGGTATVDAPATKPAKVRRPRKPDPDAPRRRQLVTDIFTEARKAADGDAEKGNAAAIERLLHVNDGKEAKDSIKFKLSDFKAEDKSVTVHQFYDFKIAYHREMIVMLEKAKIGSKSISPEKAKKKLDKIGKDISTLAAALKAQGVDVAALLGGNSDLVALLGSK